MKIVEKKDEEDDNNRKIRDFSKHHNSIVGHFKSAIL